MSVSVSTTAANQVSVSVDGTTQLSFTTQESSVSVTEAAAISVTVSEKGPKGDTGATGAQGPTGATGPAGADGKSYTISCVDGDNSDEEKIRLTDNDGTTDDVVLEAGTGLSIARSGDKITFTNTVTDTDTVLTSEQVQDIVGAMFTGNTETRISATYEDSDGTIDLVVDDMTADTQLTTEQVQDIVGAMLTGNTETRISVTYEDSDGTIDFVVDDMTANTQLSNEEVQDIVGAMFTGNTETRISATYQDSDGTIDLVVDAIPVDLTSDGAGTIHANNVPTLNQNTTGTAAGLSSTLAVSSGGTGATTLTANGVLTGNGTGAITGESNLVFDGSTLTITGQRQIVSPTGSGQFYGDTVQFGSGPSGVDGDIEQGKLYYLDSSKQWEETDADAAASATGMLALAIVDDSARFLVKGLARHSSFAGFTTGDVLYVSGTAAGITKTAPTGSGDIVRIVGYCTDGSNREIYFDPSKDWVELS
tara:strand:- start:981 stop:2414 length:1434 start_codon:yes stop_codon:yes gene_type:complete